MAVQKRPTELVDMAKLMSFQGAEPLVLHQISGPGRPRKIRLLPLEELVFGRDDDCQVILDEDPVSRRHARVLFADLKPQVLDLGSTNGTFLNGKPVHRALLKDGDQIQIGGSIFRVAMGKEGSEPLSEASVKHVQKLIQKSKGQSSIHSGQSSAISGNLSEIRLPSLLQVLESDRATGTLVVRQAGQEGKLHIHHGAVRHATLGRARGGKALYRLMVLEEGRFEFFIPGRSPEYETVEGDLQKHLLEAMRQKDEFTVYRKRLPRGDVALVLSTDMNINPGRFRPSSTMSCPRSDTTKRWSFSSSFPGNSCNLKLDAGCSRGPISSWEWVIDPGSAFGGPTSASGPTVNRTFPQCAGETVVVTLTVNGPGGASDDATQAIRLPVSQRQSLREVELLSCTFTSVLSSRDLSGSVVLDRARLENVLGGIPVSHVLRAHPGEHEVEAFLTATEGAEAIWTFDFSSCELVTGLEARRGQVIASGNRRIAFRLDGTAAEHLQFRFRLFR